MITPRQALRRYITPILATPILAVGALAAAPAAAAGSNTATCSEIGTATVCQKQGHTSLRAEPPTVSSPAGSLFSSQWLPGYGQGPMPPVLALG